MEIVRKVLPSSRHGLHFDRITRVGNDLVAEALSRLILSVECWLGMHKLVRESDEAWGYRLQVENAVVALTRILDRVFRLQARAAPAFAGGPLQIGEKLREVNADQWPSGLTETHLDLLRWYQGEMNKREDLIQTLPGGRRVVCDRRTGFVSTIATPAPASGPPAVEQPADLVTLDQAAASVHRKKRTLERYKTKGIMPAPNVQGGKGRPDLYDWETMRPWLEKEFGIMLPARFPAAPRK